MSARAKSPATLSEVRRDLAAIGYTIRKADGEYRVNVKGGAEATAYYTGDLADALGTAHAEHRRKPMSTHTPAEVQAARDWSGAAKRTGRAAREALRGMGYAPGAHGEAAVTRADFWAAHIIGKAE